jgi:hypothetical protein
MISLGPNPWISHEWAGAQSLVGLGGQRPTHWGARLSQSGKVFRHKRALLQTEILLSFTSCLGGWSQTTPQVKKPDVEVLGWRGYMVEITNSFTMLKVIFNVCFFFLPIGSLLREAFENLLGMCS